MAEPVARRLGRLIGRVGAGMRRRPYQSAVVLSLAVMVGSLVPDLFFLIPWSVRRAAGQGVMIGLVGAGVGRLLWKRPTDAWPSRAQESEIEPEFRVQRGGWTGSAILPWLLAIAVASMAWPLVRRPNGLGFGDWDHHLQKFEVIRRTILDHGQFPWWTPWCRGGFPLAAEPECGVVSVATPLVLLLGSGVGLRLATIGCLMIAVEGARRLGRLWLGDPWASIAVGLVYGLHGGILIYTVAGHYIPMSYCATPWMVLFAFRLAEGPGMGVALGGWAAFDVLNGISYPSVYGMLIAGAVWLRSAREAWEFRPARRRFLRHSVIALGTFLALAGWRLATMAAVLLDYPREKATYIDLAPLYPLAQMIHRPSPEVIETTTSPIAWETNGYIGFLGVALLIASLRRGWRWWHTLAAISFALAIGTCRWYHPSRWVSHWPVFSTMHMVTRWFVPAMLGVGLAIGDELASWRRRQSAKEPIGKNLARVLNPGWLGSRLRDPGRESRDRGLEDETPATRACDDFRKWMCSFLTAPRRSWLGPLAVLAVLLMAADLLVYGHRILPIAVGPAPEPDRFPGPATEELVNVEWGPSYPATLRGYGVIRAHEPLLGYDRGRPTARLWRGHPDYIGEAWSRGRVVRPEFWSPNRVVFQVEPGQEIHINQNPGSWWLRNGEPAFPNLRCAEWQRPFSARADDRGRLDLRIRPEGLVTGYALHGAGLLLLAGSVVGRRGSGSARPGTDESRGRETHGNGEPDHHHRRRRGGRGLGGDPGETDERIGANHPVREG